MDERKSWIETDHPLLSVRQQCQLLEINRSSLYYVCQPKMLTAKQLELLRAD